MLRRRRIHPDDKTFMNELLLRHERGMREVHLRHDRAMREVYLRHDRAMREVYRGFEQVRQSIDGVGRSIDANTAHLNDMRGEIQANTQAVLRVLDRLDGGSPA